MEPKIGGIVKAIYDFQTDEDGELPLQVGDIIQVIKGMNKQWARGRIAKKEGNFPLGFTVELQPPAIADHQQLFAVASDFTAQEPGDLTFKKGDLVIGEQPIDENWWQGTVNGESGMFPVTHVWWLDKQILPKASAKRVCLRAKVKINMKAQLKEEMDLVKDEIVIITEELEEGWYRGECNGRSGIFSPSFVTLLTDNVAEDSPNIVVSQSSDTVPNINKNQSAQQNNNQYGYDLLNSGISPYGRTLYKFQAEYDNELSFNEGQLVNLIRHVDANWLEGEVNGKVGCFPTNFIKIIVDCPSESEKSSKGKEAATSQHDTSFPADSYGRVTSDFHPQLEGDVRLREGDTVTLIRKIDQDWYEVITDNGEDGICPISYIEVIGSGPDSLPPSYVEVMSSASSSYKSVSHNSSQNSSADGSKLERPLSYPPSSADSSFTSSKGDFNASSASKSIDDKIAESLKGLDAALFSTNGSSNSERSRASSFNSSFASSEGSSFKKVEQNASFPLQQDRLPQQSTVVSLDSRSRNSWNSFDTGFDSKISSDCGSHQNVLNETRTPSRPPPPLNNSSSQILPSRASPSNLSMGSLGKGITPISSHSSLDSLADGTDQHDIKKHIEKKEQQIKVLLASKTQRQNKNRGNDNSFISTEIENEIKQFDEEIKELEKDVKSLQELLSSKTENEAEQSEDKKRRDEEVQRKREIEQKRRDQEKINKKREQRDCVITEIMQTERDYLSDLRILHDTFLKYPEEARLKGINVDTLFGNLDEVIDLASQLLSNLKQTAQAGPNKQMIGQCFINVCDDMKEVYGHYCRYHDDVNSILDKFDDQSPAGQYLKHKLEVMKRQTNCFDLPSMLIKPVQRILKYPLLLNELLKCTEDDHPDNPTLSQAIDLMTDVATSINEFKRRKDLVFKYRKQSNTSFSGKISKLSIHSMLKKSSRLGLRFSSSIGLKSVIKDPEFDEIQQKFESLQKTLKIFLKDINKYSVEVEQLVLIALTISEDIAEIYQERKSQEEVEQFQVVRATIATQYWEAFKQTIERSVDHPIKRLLQAFQGPNNIIQKRYDKLLDYEACTNKMEKNKDATKIKMFQDNQLMAKNTYEALNSQLLVELPKLFIVSIEIFYDCIRCFLKAKKTFIGKTAHQMLNLMELPLLLGSQGSSILETFQVKHTIVMDDLSQLSIVPKQFQSCYKTDTLRRNSSPRNSRLSFGSSLPANKSQNNSQKAFVKSRYPEADLYNVCQTYGAADLMDISLKKGDLVGVIKQQDPMGNKHRWFVDNGDKQGFVPAKFLIKHLSSDEPQPSRRSSLEQNTFSTLPTKTTTDARNQSLYSIPQKKTPPAINQTRNPNRTLIPSRPAPPILTRTVSNPIPTRVAIPARANQSSLSVVEPQHRYEKIDDSDGRYDTVSSDLPPFLETPPPYTPPPYQPEPKNNVSVLLNEFDPYTMNASNLYDNVPDNANNLYDSQRYEEIPDGGRYDEVPSESQPEGSGEYHYALYEFCPTGANQLSLKKGQVVLVLHKCDLNSNSEWWFVEDRHGNKGYVPSAYLKKYLESRTSR